MTGLPATPQTEHVALASGVTLHIVHWRPVAAHDHQLRVPWLLVHGLSSNAHLWDGVGRRLADAGHHAVAVDLRGHGTSSTPDDGYDIATVADDLALLIEALGFDRPAIAGQSWGGNVAVDFASRHPEHLSLLVGVDGGTIRLRDQFESWEACAEALRPPSFVGRSLADIESWLLQMAGDWPEEGRTGTLANFEVHDDKTVSPKLSLERHLLVLRGLWDHDPLAQLAHITVPTLLIGADPTPLDTNPTDDMQRRAARLDAAIEVTPRGVVAWFRPAHHDVHAQQPAAVAALLLEAQNDPLFFA